MTKTIGMTILAASVLAVSPALSQHVEAPRGGRPDIGKLEYESKCATCHGVKGEGDGPTALYLTHKTADLRTLARANNGILPIADIYDVIVADKLLPAHGSREMPVWGREYRIEAATRPDGHAPGDRESFVRSRVLAIIEYIGRLQVK